jgi:NTP pyrophosphatase (non-canonical NTP hydrolase)
VSEQSIEQVESLTDQRFQGPEAVAPGNVMGYAQEIINYSVRNGFLGPQSGREFNIGERLMLIVSELGEAIEADRYGKWARGIPSRYEGRDISSSIFEREVKDTFECELADAAIRLIELCAWLDIDLDWYIREARKYAEGRPFKHGKAY